VVRNGCPFAGSRLPGTRRQRGARVTLRAEIIDLGASDIEMTVVGALVPDFRALLHSVTVHSKVPRESFQVEVNGKLAALVGGQRSPRNIVGDAG